MNAPTDHVVSRKGLGGVVVTFNPEQTVVKNLEAMVRECGQVWAIDNGSSLAARALITSVPGVALVALEENVGLAHALNRGAELAVANGCQWIVTFDQDSCPQVGMVAALWAEHLRLPAAAVIGPRIEELQIKASSYRWVRQHPRWPWLFQRAFAGPDLEVVTMVITSGSLVDLGLWRQIGGFDAALFIDYIDIDFCLRAIRAGRRVAVAAAAVLAHRLGSRRSTIALGHEFRPMHHAPFRHYYIARNRVRIWRRHALAVPHWALFDLSFAGLNIFRVLVFESNKRVKFKAMLLGTWDGLRGRGGPCPEQRRQALQK